MLLNEIPINRTVNDFVMLTRDEMATIQNVVLDLRNLHRAEPDAHEVLRCEECQNFFPCPTIKTLEGTNTE